MNKCDVLYEQFKDVYNNFKHNELEYIKEQEQYKLLHNLFDTQYVIVNDQLYSCDATFHPTGNLKCACQRLYGGRPHLLNDLNPAYNECLDMLDRNIKKQYPILTFPTITCLQCKKEFEDLSANFSYENLTKVKSCINNLSTAQQPLEKKELVEDQHKFNPGLFLLAILALFLVVLMIVQIVKRFPKNMVFNRYDMIKQVDSHFHHDHHQTF